MRFAQQRLQAQGLILITPKRCSDDRGYFMETYRAEDFDQLGICTRFVQDNESLSLEPGTVRGLHFQRPPHCQAKLVRVVTGAIFDVAVDIRRGSPTYGTWCAARLDANNQQQMFVPAGFAHGYCTLEPLTIVAYKCDTYYNAGAEGGIHYSDLTIAIDWPIPSAKLMVSEKDRNLPCLSGLASPFNWDG